MVRLQAEAEGKNLDEMAQTRSHRARKETKKPAAASEGKLRQGRE
jgi:hypothetical protein